MEIPSLQENTLKYRLLFFFAFRLMNSQSSYQKFRVSQWLSGRLVFCLSREERVELHPVLPNIVCETWGKAGET